MGKTLACTGKSPVTEESGAAVTLQTYIREMLGSNLNQDTGYSDRGLS
jgi:hypothetical protein